MIDRSLIEKIQEMALEAAETTMIEGREYSHSPLSPIEDPLVGTLKTQSLDSVAQYIAARADINCTPKSPAYIHIVDHQTVSILTMADQWRNRERHVTAIAPEQCHSFDQDMNLESAIVWLQAGFVQDENTAAVLRLLGNVSHTLVAQWDDDGVTQAVSAKVGLTMKEQVPVPNPVTLRPFRTFSEIYMQPASNFVLRLKSRENQPPTVKLVEGDGGAWKKNAMNSIADYFKSSPLIDSMIEDGSVIILQ